MNQAPLKILSVEDNDFDFELLERKLKSLDFQFELIRVQIEEDFRNILDNFCPDLILSDFSLPSFSGLEALNIAKKICPAIPFIFVSGTIGEELAVETLLQGANDYVLKDNLHKLEFAIKRALSEAKEKVKRKQAEGKLKIKIDELKSMVYRISHDIRGPICSIKGVVSLIQQSKDKSMEEIQEYSNIINQVAKKMEGIVLNLSSFQFIYNEEIKAECINLEEFIKKINEAVSEIEGYEKVDFNVNYSGQKSFLCEYNLLYTILYHLIQNAIVFIDDSKSVSKISYSINVSENIINLLVEDNGIGIPENIQDKIFGMFYRGNNKSRGAGLGLYITKTILERLKGQVTIESKENIGSKFEVIIPALKTHMVNN